MFCVNLVAVCVHYICIYCIYTWNVKLHLCFQILILRDQLKHDMRLHGQFITRSSSPPVRHMTDAHDYRTSLVDVSPTRISRNSDLDPILLEHESRKMETRHRSTSPGKVTMHTTIFCNHFFIIVNYFLNKIVFILFHH